MTVEPLPLPDDVRIAGLLSDWREFYESLPPTMYPRAMWLHDFEAVLREHYPTASSDRLTLTARLAAPFPLALPGVP